MSHETPLVCLFENEAFALFDKPAGLSFHSEAGAGLVVQAAALLGCQLFAVHRLDKMTSGLILCAKSSQVAAQLTERFAMGHIDKYYVAISLRKPKKKQGWIKGDMQRSRRGSWKLTTTMEQPAITRFVSTALRPKERLFLVKPLTGKTHQIRVALKAVGAPIAGDTRYADATEAQEETRGYLHAYALRFELEGECYTFIAPPKEGERFTHEICQGVLKGWRSPWTLFGDD